MVAAAAWPKPFIGLVGLGSVTRNGVVNRGAVRYLSVFARFRCGPLAATPGVQRAHKWNPNDERRRKFFWN